MVLENEKDVLKGWRTWFHPDLIPARGVLGILSFFGTCTNYMLRVNMNIAIVSMTSGGVPSVVGNVTVLSECVAADLESNSLTYSSLAPTPIIAPQVPQEAEFSWSTHDQALVLGSFYWSYICTMVAGGMLAERYGAKWVFGGANLVSGIMALATPLAARWHITALIGVRLVQGLASGMIYPALHTMASRWIPPHERSKFCTTYIGSAVGVAVTYPLCGLLIDLLGSWVWAFYVPALICFVFCTFWFVLAFDSPAQHPRIAPSELDYLELTVSQHLAKGKPKVPWLRIARSLPFWAMLIACVGNMWCVMTIITYGPTYLKNVHGFGIRENGLLSGLTNLSPFLFAMLFSWFVDSLLAAHKCSVTFARKMATAVSVLVPALMFLLMGNMGCNSAAEVAALTLAQTFGTASSSGSLVNSVDIAPNFAGTILGLESTVSMSTGFLVPLAVSRIIGEDQSVSRWQIVFVVAAVLNFTCAIFFTLFGSGEVQSWNEPSDLESSVDQVERKDSVQMKSPS